MPGAYIFKSKKQLDEFEGAKRGDIGVIDKTGFLSKTYMYYDGKWVELQGGIEKPDMKSDKKPTVCPTCGARQFTKIDDRHYKCEYCGNTYFV